jgi:PhnB protein
MQLSTYIYFSGNCAEAFAFYEKALGGKIVMMMTYGETPEAEHMPSDWSDAIIHARMSVGDAVLMGSDAPPDRYSRPQGFSVSVTTDTTAEAERIFAALAEDGSVYMPMDETFFAARFGMLSDKFGIGWMVACEART